MAGIGVKLNHIYGKNTLTTNLAGMAYSTIVTIAPMIVVIAALIVMQKLLGFSGGGLCPQGAVRLHHPVYFHIFPAYGIPI